MLMEGSRVGLAPFSLRGAPRARLAEPRGVATLGQHVIQK